VSRTTTPPHSDVARSRAALWKMAEQCGIDLDSSMADHEIAELISHRLSNRPTEIPDAPKE